MTVEGEPTQDRGPRAPGKAWRTALKAAGFAMLMLGVCWVSIVVPRLLGRNEGIWPANALTLTLLMLSPPGRWPAWLAAAGLGDVLAGMLTGETAGMSSLLAGCNLLEVVVSALAVRHLVGERLDLSRIDHLARFTLVAGVVAPLISATLAAWVLGGLRGANPWFTLGSWVAADGLGAVILAPLIMTLRDHRRHLAETPLTPRAWLALAVLVATTVTVFSVRQPLVFLLPPALLLVVFQLEVLGAAWGVLIVLIIAVAFTAMGLGPTYAMHHSAADTVVVVQLFLAAITLTSLPTAAALAQRRRLQAAGAASEARYRLVTEASRDVVLKFDAGGEILFVSQASRLFGYEPSNLVGRNAFELIHPDDLPATMKGLAALMANTQPSRTHSISEFRARLAGGGYVWVEGNPSVIRDEAGEPIAFTNALRDITKRKAMEAELRAARAAAEAAAAVKSDFLANMSHELRTPLTSVIGFTRLALGQEDLSQVSRGFIDKAAGAGEALLATVNDILDFSKLESGQLQIRREAADPATVCRETLALFSETAAAKALTLRFTSSGLPGRLSIDPSRLRQLLLNLIGNAVKFSEQGEIEVVAGWSPDDQRLAISVQDHGPGIAPEQQALLFRRFSQVDGTSTRRHGGTGLGLAICRGLVEAMAGTIGVESEPGRGARFYFEIPAEPADAPEYEAEADELLFPAGVRILVADDHPANRELVRAVLTPFGADVREAANGAEAAETAAKAPFDLILMDLRMPVLDGFAAMKAIRRGEGPNRDTPILAFSAGADIPGAEARLSAGFDGDLSKPVLPADLIAAVCHFAPGENPPVYPAELKQG